jgi:uncharacterized protein (DUF488 family)
MSTSIYPVFTIGHSTHSIDVFMALLRRHDVTVVADVRSEPYSRFSPQFNEASLKDSLKAYGIKYVFLGRELGARSKDRSCYVDGRVQFALLAQTDLFLSGIERIVRGANDYRIALMCAEKDPLECHRTLLVARNLVERGIAVEHILADGRSESHETTMERLLDVVGLPHEDLFRSRTELISEALAKQAERVAYVDEKLAATTGRNSA